MTKVHSITFYIELSSNYEGVGVKSALLKENWFGDPIFLFFFLKGNIRNKNFEIVIAKFFNIQFNLILF